MLTSLSRQTFLSLPNPYLHPPSYLPIHHAHTPAFPRFTTSATISPPPHIRFVHLVFNQCASLIDFFRRLVHMSDNPAMIRDVYHVRIACVLRIDKGYISLSVTGATKYWNLLEYADGRHSRQSLSTRHPHFLPTSHPPTISTSMHHSQNLLPWPPLAHH